MAVLARFGSIIQGLGLNITGVHESGRDFVQVWGYCALGLIVVLAMPNSLEMLMQYSPALGFKVRPSAQTILLLALRWTPSRIWAIGLSVVTALGLMSLGRLSDFLYWHF
jgi:hypothetical protein